VIAIRDVLTDQVQMIPSADFMIKDSDILVVIGKEEDIRKLT
jgi:trk system potassium uptake protein TrkA